MKRAGLLILLTACATDVKAPDLRDPRGPRGASDPKMHAIILTASAPRQEVAISPFAAAPTMLTIVIATIDNPSSQAFSVGAGVTWNTADAHSTDQDIGSITPFPASEPGSFLLSVPAATRELLSRNEGRSSLRLSLQPIAADRPLAEPLRVTIGDLVWR